MHFFFLSLYLLIYSGEPRKINPSCILSRLYIMQHFERHLALHLENTQGTDSPLAHPSFYVV